MLNTSKEVYVLIDANSGLVRYVGVTGQPLSKRLSQHLSAANSRSNHLSNWIRSLQCKPVIASLETSLTWQEAEVFWISYLRSLGFSLVNSTSGGEGVPNPPAEVRHKIGSANRGKVFSESRRAKMSEAQRGKKMSPSAIEKTRRAHLGAKRSEETKAKLREQRSSEEYREAQSKRLRGRVFTEETRRRMRDSSRRRWDRAKSLTGVTISC
jgi:hypothetical protein